MSRFRIFDNLSNKSSDQDELNDSVSKTDIDKMIRFLHAHTDYKVVKNLIIRLSKIRNLDIAHQRSQV
jgi:hypothetical protein